MHFDFANINWLAVAVAGIGAFLIGGIWYQALFGKAWKSLHNFTPEQLEAVKCARPPAVFFGGMIVAYLIVALAVELIVVRFDVRTAPSGLKLGGVLWVLAAAIGFTGWLASGKRLGIFVIDAGCQLVYLLMMGAVLACWR